MLCQLASPEQGLLASFPAAVELQLGESHLAGAAGAAGAGAGVGAVVAVGFAVGAQAFLLCSRQMPPNPGRQQKAPKMCEPVLALQLAWHLHALSSQSMSCTQSKVQKKQHMNA